MCQSIDFKKLKWRALKENEEDKFALIRPRPPTISNLSGRLNSDVLISLSLSRPSDAAKDMHTPKQPHFSLSPRLFVITERKRAVGEARFSAENIMPVHLSSRIASNWSDIPMPCRCDVGNETPHLSPKTTTLWKKEKKNIYIKHQRVLLNGGWWWKETLRDFKGSCVCCAWWLNRSERWLQPNRCRDEMADVWEGRDNHFSGRYSSSYSV